jgi:hypothetical protein
MQECVGNSILPAEGDVAVCFECSEPAIYTITRSGGWMLRAPTGAERKAICARPEMSAIRRAFLAEPDSPAAAAAIARWTLTSGRHGQM